MDYIFRTLIVPSAFQQLAKGLCAAAAEPGAADGMFDTGLSPAGQSTATLYISSGAVAAEFGAVLPLTTFAEEGTPTTRPGNVAAVEAIADQAGITLPPGTIEALFAVIDVTEQDPFAAMARLGVSIIQPEEL